MFQLFVIKDLVDKNETIIELLKIQQNLIKKAHLSGLFVNGGTDEARTRDLLRDRQAL